MITNTTRGWVTRMQAVCLSLLCAFALLGLSGHALAQDPLGERGRGILG